MKRIVSIVAGAVVAGGVAAAPAVAGLAGNPSFSHTIAVRVPTAAKTPALVDDHGHHQAGGDDCGRGRADDHPHRTVTVAATATARPSDDRGGPTRRPERGDDRGGESPAHVEPGDDRGGSRTQVEPGDDRGGVSSALEPGDDSGGRGGRGDGGRGGRG